MRKGGFRQILIKKQIKQIKEIKNNKFILPWEFDLWLQIDLFENAIVLKRYNIVLKRYNKERVIFSYELIAIEPILINSLFTKGKYFGYVLNGKDGNRTVLKSSYLCDLDIFISELCSLFKQEKGAAVITDID